MLRQISSVFVRDWQLCICRVSTDGLYRSVTQCRLHFFCSLFISIISFACMFVSGLTASSNMSESLMQPV